MSKATYNLDVKEDGVYLIITKIDSNTVVSAKEVMSKIDSFGIKDADLSVLASITESEDLIISKKISSNKEVASIDEIANINISADKMSATITFEAPIHKGVKFTKEDIIRIIDTSNVKLGLDQKLIDEICINRVYNFPYKIATGKAHKDGVDGYVKYNFTTDKKSLKPVLLDDGTADYFNIKLYEQTDEGNILAQRIEPVDGENGFDVTGSPIQAKVGKIPNSLPTGKNVAISEDGKYTVATSNGQIEYKNGKLNVNPVLVLKEVNNSTGNIEFNGAVIIEGDVTDGFEISASGNIEVKGMVEGSKIESDADIFLHNGIMGREKAVIIAEGNIVAKFIDNSKISAGGSIYADSIMHSNIDCNKEVVLKGKNGIIVGGRACVGEKIDASVIGSGMATLTELEVGNTPARVQAFKNLEESLGELISTIFKTDQIISVLKSSKVELTPEKKNILLKSYHTKIFLINKKTKIEQQISEILPTLASDKGLIIVTKKVFTGVKITIGNSKYSVDDEIESCRFQVVDEKIEVGSCF